MKHYDVVVIGGGITGAGVARDCALRGLSVLLLERFDITNGATGRNHGLLHSGARYAVTDPESAAECIRENRILRRIAAHCVEETEGLSITLPEDDLSYQKKFIESCNAVGIKAEAIDPALALKMEPALNPAITGAVKIPDASIDPFRLATANVLDANLHGADTITYATVTGFLTDSSRIVGARFRDASSGRSEIVYANMFVNAAGIWGAGIAAMAGVKLEMYPSKGTLLIFGHRVNKMVINRCRKPSDADILVPGDIVCVIGTTSSKVDIGQCDDIRATPGEVRMLLAEGCRISPVLSKTRVLRAYAGVRPLIADDNDPTGRSISRGIILLDHEERDGLAGFITITGGKLTTYRLMAQQATDLICRKLGVAKPCLTAKTPLPGSEHPQRGEGSVSFKAAETRHGTRISKMNFASKSEVICECEHVSRAEIEYAVKFLDVHNLIDLRRRTRVGMGTCQGTSCVGRVAKVLAEVLGCPERENELVKEYLAERWKGVVPVCWGDALREAEYMRKIYRKK